MSMGPANQNLVVTGATDINTDHSCSRALDPDLALAAAQARTASTMSPDGEQPTHLSLLLTAFTSQICLSPQDMNLLSLSPPYPTIYLLTITDTFKAAGRFMFPFPGPEQRAPVIH